MKTFRKFLQEESGPDYGVVFSIIIYQLFPQYFGLPPANPNSGPPFPEGTVPPDILNVLDYDGDGQITFADMLIALQLHGYGEDVGQDGYDQSDVIPPEYLEGLPKGAVVLGIPAYWYHAMNGITPYWAGQNLVGEEPMTKQELMKKLQLDAKSSLDGVSLVDPKVETPLPSLVDPKVDIPLDRVSLVDPPRLGVKK